MCRSCIQFENGIISREIDRMTIVRSMKKSASNKSNAPDLQKRRSVACATIDQAISAQLNVFECEQCKVKMCDHVLADTEPVDRE